MKHIDVTLLDDSSALTLDEICRAIHADNDLIVQLVEYHIIEPKGTAQESWIFDHVDLKRARLARNFYYDLEVNLAGIGLLLDMLDRIDALESTIARLR